MSENARRFIKRINKICGIVGGAVFIGLSVIAALKIGEVISDWVFIGGTAILVIAWWTVYGIKYVTEHKLINELKDWAQHVVDTNYYQGQQITVKCRNGIWFSGPEDSWFRKRFITHCKELCADTGMKIYYNYSWIRV